MASASGWMGKKWGAPVMRPMWPFYAAGVVIFYGISSGAKAMAMTDEHKNDPRNQYAKSAAQSH